MSCGTHQADKEGLGIVPKSIKNEVEFPRGLHVARMVPEGLEGAKTVPEEPPEAKKKRHQAPGCQVGVLNVLASVRFGNRTKR